ncbi:MAG: hypothetical protein MZW92_12885 [Comamonadaceae bacterium]|nr:hypothetical protein [Comamonadaceae bacterium]
MLAKAQALSREFAREENAIQSVRMSMDQTIADTVNDINQMTAEIARLNAVVGRTEGSRTQEELAPRRIKDRCFWTSCPN